MLAKAMTLCLFSEIASHSSLYETLNASRIDRSRSRLDLPRRKEFYNAPL